MSDKVCVDRADLLMLLRALDGQATDDFQVRSAYGNLRAAAFPPPELVDLFEQFWLAYGRKVDRKPARKAWDKIIKAGVDPCMVIEAAREYRQFCLRPNTPNQKNAATWLNNECWDNELVPWEPTQQSRTERNTERIKDGIVSTIEGPSFLERLAKAGLPQPQLGA